MTLSVPIEPALLSLILVVCGATIFLSWAGVRFLTLYLRQKNIVDRPNERSMHSGEIPRGGGLVVVGLISLCLIFLTLSGHRPAFFLAILACSLAWATLSWADDRFELGAGLRLIVQSLIAIMTVVLLGWVGKLGGLDLLWLGPPMTVMGVLWMANLNNFMDGMDGLAASQAIVAGITLSIWFLYLGDRHLALLSAIVASASYGFLLCNWHPAKIFMGDVGSVTLGGLYAMLIIVAVNRHDVSVISVLMIFSVFIADATITMLSRLLKGEKVWLPHRSHFYQRAGLAGVRHDKIVIIAILLMMLSSLIATLSVLYHDIITQLVFLMTLILIITGVWVNRLERQSSGR